MRWRKRQRGCGSLAAATAASLAVEGAAWRKRDFVGSGSALGSAATAATLAAVAARWEARWQHCCRASAKLRPPPPSWPPPPHCHRRAAATLPTVVLPPMKPRYRHCRQSRATAHRPTHYCRRCRRRCRRGRASSKLPPPLPSWPPPQTRCHRRACRCLRCRRAAAAAAAATAALWPSCRRRPRHAANALTQPQFCY